MLGFYLKEIEKQDNLREFLANNTFARHLKIKLTTLTKTQLELAENQAKLIRSPGEAASVEALRLYLTNYRAQQSILKRIEKEQYLPALNVDKENLSALPAPLAQVIEATTSEVHSRLIGAESSEKNPEAVFNMISDCLKKNLSKLMTAAPKADSQPSQKIKRTHSNSAFFIEAPEAKKIKSENIKVVSRAVDDFNEAPSLPNVSTLLKNPIDELIKCSDEPSTSEDMLGLSTLSAFGC